MLNAGDLDGAISQFREAIKLSASYAPRTMSLPSL